MEYVEILRARRVLLWYGVCLLGLLALVVLSVYAAKSGSIHVDHAAANVSTIVRVCTLGAWIVTTSVAPIAPATPRDSTEVGTRSRASSRRYSSAQPSTVTKAFN